MIYGMFPINEDAASDLELNWYQEQAIRARDSILARKLGVSLEDYISVITPKNYYTNHPHIIM